MDKKLKLKTELAKKLKKETSVTGTGAFVTPGTGEGVATKYAFGKRKNTGTPKDWKPAPSIPNRSSKAIDYKELYESELKLGVKYDYKGESGFISTGGSNDPRNWKFLSGKKPDQYPYLAVKADLVPSKKQPGKYDGAFDMGLGKGHHIDEAGTDEVVAILNNPNLDLDVKKTLMSAYRQGHITADGVLAIVDLILKKGSLQEVKLDIDDRIKVTYGNEFYGETGTITDIKRGFVTVEMDRDGKEYSMHLSDVQKIEDEDDDDMIDEGYYEFDMEDDDQIDYNSISDLEDELSRLIRWSNEFGHKGADAQIDQLQKRIEDLKKQSIKEGYAKFRNETKMRSKPDQFHQAVKQIKQKMYEINRIFEYVDRLKSELSEGEDLKYKKYTENAFQQIKESAKKLFLKSTKLK